MLLNEFLKEHRKVGQLQATVAELKAAAAKQEAINAQQQKGMEALAAIVKEQASQIQKVSDPLEHRLLRLVWWRIIELLSGPPRLAVVFGAPGLVGGAGKSRKRRIMALIALNSQNEGRSDAANRRI